MDGLGDRAVHRLDVSAVRPLGGLFWPLVDLFWPPVDLFYMSCHDINFATMSLVVRVRASGRLCPAHGVDRVSGRGGMHGTRYRG
jgi:hypothetical protein